MNARQPIEQTLRHRIAQQIHARPGITASEITKALKMTSAPSRVVLELNAMRTDGLVEAEMINRVLHYTLAVGMDDIAASAAQIVALDLPASIKPGTRAAQVWADLGDGRQLTARQLTTLHGLAPGALDPTIGMLYTERTIERTKGPDGVYRYHRPRDAAPQPAVGQNTGSRASDAPLHGNSRRGRGRPQTAPEPAAPSPSAAPDAEDDADDDAMPDPDPALLLLANRMLADRLDGVAHVLRGCGLEALRNVTGCEDLQPHVAALSGAYQMALQKIDVLSNERHDFLRSAHTTIEAASEWLAEVVEGGDIEASEMSVEELAMRAAGELKNARALVEKLEHLLQAARNEAEHLRAHGAADRNMVDHPPHYTAGGIECIDAIESALGPDGFAAYCRGNAIKYAWRAGLKGSAAQDLAKGAWYLARCAGRDRDSQAEARP